MSDFLPKPDEGETFFGLKKVGFGEKKKLVRDIFDSVAPKYDLMNDLMSLGLHRLWKKILVDRIKLQANDFILDMAGGTGDISFKIHQKAEKLNIPIHITNADLTFAMLTESITRAIDKGIANICTTNTDAQSLPFQSDSFNHYVISFGLRNVPSREMALLEAFRVLKPGGHFYCMEFSHIFIPKFKKLYQNYSFRFIPKLGEKFGNDRDSYQYLVDSIETFPNQEDLAAELRSAGFDSVNFRNLSFGLVAIHYGTKPL